jgi:hypothetical protein
MAKVAQDHLAIPAAEVDVERLFNGGRDVLGPVLTVGVSKYWSISDSATLYCVG